jgi:hypothetical protein
VGQVTGISSWSGGGIDGFQVSGVMSVAGGPLRGFQIAGITNQVRGDTRGLQLAGIHNYTSGDVRGVQVGLVNYGGGVGGAQIGLVNVARRIDGLQLGLVNVATESSAGGAPIGLLSLAPDGRRDLELWIADVLPGRIGFKLGSRSMYTLLAVAGSDELLAAGAGLGVHLPGRAHYVDIDLTGYEVLSSDFEEADGVDALAELRAMVAIPLDLGFAVFGGVSAAGVMSWDSLHPARDLGLVTLREVGGDGDDFTMRISPGLFVGLSY